LLVVLGVLRVFHERQQRGLPVHHRSVQRAGWLVPGDEWLEIIDFLQAEQLVCATAGDAWVLSRDLASYPLQQLLSHWPWPLPRLQQLPAQLDEPWYPALRKAFELFYQQQEQLFSGSLSQWLQPPAQ
jgi:membrane protein